MVAGLISLTGVVASASTGAAQGAPEQIKQNNAWGSYSYSGSEGKTCFVLSVPTDKNPKTFDGKAVDHGDVFFMLARHPGQNVQLEPHFTTGYAFKENSQVVVDIDGRKFSMFTVGKKAWLENPAEELAVVNAMKAGSQMNVSAVSKSGKNTSYTYSLSGVTASISDLASCN